MPIYMDRHYVEGASTLAMETAHKQDLEIQGDFGVNLMTYWFDEERSTVFCLAKAPNEKALRDLHAQAHGFVPNEETEVDPLIVQAFLGRIEDPVVDREATEGTDQGGIDTAYRLIMFTDMKDSTQIAVQLGDEKAMHLIRIHNAITREAIKANNGREVKTTGDGFLLSFVNSVDALDCAIAIQESFKEYNEKSPREKLYVRIGITAGEPIEERGDIYGTAVNLASRLCTQAKAGGVLITQIVRDEIEDGGEKVQFASGGTLTLKGFVEPVDVYEVFWDQYFLTAN